jgi:hypothetical protein
MMNSHCHILQAGAQWDQRETSRVQSFITWMGGLCGGAIGSVIQLR